MLFRGLFLSSVLLLTVGGLVPVFADSVFVSNSSLQNAPGVGAFTGTFYCQQFGTSSASCQTGSSSRAGIGSIDSGGYVSASAAFGKVSGGVTESNANGRFVASFSDDVVVTGGAGSGTLISHYSLVTEGEAFNGPPAEFVFVQGSSKTGVTPDYTFLGSGPGNAPNPPPGCEGVGFCFSESYDVASPIQFGAALPFGAEAYLGTPSGESLIGLPNSDVTAYSNLNLTGYTVLDDSGNVIGDATVTRGNLPTSFNLDFTPEPGTWGLIVVGLGMLGAWRLRRLRGVLLALVGLVAVGGAVPVRADSVYVTSSSFPPDIPGQSPTGTYYCQQSGTASAGCGTNYSTFNGRITGEGFAQATAAFGALSGQIQSGNSGPAYFVASFSDDVVVTGGSGSGTLVAHYALAAAADATGGMGAGNFSFVQGSTKTGVVPDFTNLGYTTPHLPPPPGCDPTGLCFSETFNVTSPIRFGNALPLGAEAYLTSDGFGPSQHIGGGIQLISAGSNLNLTGYTVLDGSGNVVGDAVVTPQNVPGLDLFPTPEPLSSGLVMMGLGLLGAWRLRKRRALLLSLVGLVAVGGAVPLWADSVFVSNTSPNNIDGPLTGTFYCQQYGTSSASCSTGASSFNGRIDVGGSAQASAAFGSAYGGLNEQSSIGRFVSSFGDDVIVAGGAGTGTLISHYSIAASAYYSTGGGAALFSFVQGSTKTGVSAVYTDFGYEPPFPTAPPGCQYVGFCFSESYDVSSPVQFGAALPLGAQIFRELGGGADLRVSAGGYGSVNLDGYTVLDASGNVIADATVTRQNVPGLNLDFTPEPVSSGLMLAGLGMLGAWGLRKRQTLG